MRRLVAALCFAPVVALACSSFKDDEPCVGALCGDAGGADATTDVTLDTTTDVAPPPADASDAGHASDAHDASFDVDTFDGGTAVVGLALAAGYTHTCALLANGSVECWGATDNGQLGIGDDAGAVDGSTPILVPGLAHVTAIGSAADALHTCAVGEEGGVSCWGANDQGQIGLAAPPIATSPTRVAGIGAMRAVAASDDSTCGVLADDSAMQCWGNWSWFISHGAVTSFGGFDAGPVTSFAGTDTSYCVAYGKNEMGCFGDSLNGELGDPDAAASGTFVPITGVTSVAHVSAGGWGHVCAALTDGTVMCWGSNSEGECGGGQRSTTAKPTLVPGVDDAVQVAVGNQFSCARRRDGYVMCWGSNSATQCGVTGPSPILAPQVVPLVTHATNIAAGANHACAVVDGKRILCWGDASNGQHGDGVVGLGSGPSEVKL